MKGINSVKQVWYRHGTSDNNDWQTFVRTLDRGIWSQWRRFAVEDDIKTMYSLLMPKTTIPENSDLNDYLTPGHYRTENGATSATIRNTPYTKTGFKLTVERLSSELHSMQTLKGAASSVIYWRTYDKDSWSDWHEM